MIAALAGAWWDWVAAAALPVAALAAVVLLLDVLLLRRAWPSLRLALWWVVLARLALPPGIASPLGVDWFPRATAAGSTLGVQPAVPSAAPLVLAALWAAGLALCLLVVLRRARRRRALIAAAGAPSPRVAAIARRAAAALGLRRAPGLAVLDGCGGPCVVGVLRPVVLLTPADAARPARELFHVLLHELAHVRRRDPLAAALVGGLRAAFWFHPAAHVAARRIAVLRELCCDATVADRLRDATPRYRETLLAEAGRRLLRPAEGLAWRGRAPVLQRLEALARPCRRPRLRRAGSAAAGLLAFACALPGAPQPPAPSAVAPLDAQAQARAVLQLAADGGRPGCLRLHAALTLLSDPANSRSSP